MNSSEEEVYLIDVYGERLTKNSSLIAKENEELRDDEDAEYIIETIKRLRILFKLKTWKNAFEWSKQNISTALIWISGIGAVIQVIELISIHPSYIKFFSVTQLISDGSLILSILIIMAATYSIISIFMPRLVLKRMILDIDKKRSFSTYDKYIRYACWFVGSLSCIAAFMEINIASIQKKMIFQMILVSSILVTLRFSLDYYAIFDKYLQETDDNICILKRLNFKMYYKAFNRLMIIATIMTIAIVSIKSVYLFTKASRLPYNLENYEIVNDRISTDYGSLENHEIRYFNDTYCFIEIKKNKEEQSKIIIYKTDDVMFQTKKIQLEQ